MSRQSYHNHIRWYAPHHFVYYPVLLILLGISVYFSFTRPETAVWIFMSLILILLFSGAYMLRQHYSLKLQNRIVKLELRYRYFAQTGNRFEEFEQKLRDSQLFALRFAPDSELEALVKSAVNNKLSAGRIKKSIVSWKGDYARV
ncbi:MAG TPA: DUF6526 family protein [Flavobacterium sp.]|nr:DUF6526 family protein [Flavobacterium sp.]